MQLVIGPDGSGRCLYGEDINLGKLGKLTISRASHVEPDDSGSVVRFDYRRAGTWPLCATQ